MFSKFRWDGKNLLRWIKSAGGCLSARLFYILLFTLFSFSALCLIIDGKAGSITFQDFGSFSVSGASPNLEIKIQYEGKKPQISQELSNYIKEQSQNLLLVVIPIEKEPVFLVSINTLRLSWKESKVENSIFFVKDPPVYPIGSGDRLLVEVYGVEDINKEVVVDPQGFVTLPLVERLSVKDMTLNDLQKYLEEKYSEYIQDPQINIQLKEYGSRFVNVLGEVDSPKRIALKKALRLLDAISEAGGFTAKSGDIEVQRRDATGSLQKILISKDALLSAGEGSENIYVFDQDTINVLPVASIYVSGQVKSPQSIQYTKDLTLLRAIAKAGGFTEWANKDKIIILRQDPSGETKSIRVDASRIEKGKDKDVPLLPNDHIVVYERKLF